MVPYTVGVAIPHLFWHLGEPKMQTKHENPSDMRRHRRCTAIAEEGGISFHLCKQMTFLHPPADFDIMSTALA